MITTFKVNNFEFTADNRAYAKITGLTPCDLAVNTINVAGHKRISGATRDNREIQITGAVADVSFIKDIYKHLTIGNTYNIKIETEDTEKPYYTDGIVSEITVDRYKLPVTYTIKIECNDSYLYGAKQTYEATDSALTVNIEDTFDIPQDNIKIYHTIQSGEKSLTVDFFGSTVVDFGEGYEGKEIVVDLLKQTCKIGGKNRFYLVTKWADGSWSESFSIPANTKIIFKEKVLGVF